MLELPSKGLSRSIKKHNVDLSLFVDWLEACALFNEDVTGGDVVDALREENLYADQDFAWELFSNAAAMIHERARGMGEGYPLEMPSSTRIVARGNWNEFSPYAFCLTLSLLDYFPDWAKAFGKDFNEQGQLFEQLTAESAQSLFSGWSTYATGWTRTRANKLNSVVSEVAARLREPTGMLGRWTNDRANDAGLDLLCYRDFHDGRPGLPAMLFQCASGADWPNKLNTPNLRVWTKIITFPNYPKKAFSMPFALDYAEFTKHCNLVDGLLLDRTRLLAPGVARRDWVTPALKNRLIAWIDARIASLPQAEAA